MIQRQEVLECLVNGITVKHVIRAVPEPVNRDELTAGLERCAERLRDAGKRIDREVVPELTEEDQIESTGRQRIRDIPQLELNILRGLAATTRGLERSR